MQLEIFLYVYAMQICVYITINNCVIDYIQQMQLTAD